MSLSCTGIAGSYNTHSDAGADSSLIFLPADSALVGGDSAICTFQGTKNICSTTLAGECAAGSQICLSDGEWSSCEPEIQPGTRAEDCGNSQDDDCDGLTDAYDPDCASCVASEERACAVTGLPGECARGTQRCSAAATWGTCQGPAPLAEDCGNGLDDDCDGDIDGGDADCTDCTPGQEESCTVPGAQGRCREGTHTCQPDGAWGTCTGPSPQAETCGNGLDDDCDGSPDATDADCFECVPASIDPCVAGGWTGICADGTRTCTGGGTWGSCLPRPPQTESCANQKDDDCDGKTDTSDSDCFTCTPGTQDSCTSTGELGICRNGKKTCTAAGSWGVCVAGSPVTESCENGLDDDCDGKTDAQDTDCYECSPGALANCTNTTAQGICRDGQRTCSTTGTWSACVAGAPATESCENGLDDDCDGKTDAQDTDCFECSPKAVELCLIPTLKGMCATGQRTCSQAGTWGTCQQKTFPGTESCGTPLDEDCDGATGYRDTDCLTPVYRMYNASTGDHMNSLSSTEGSALGYTSEGVHFQMLAGDVIGPKQALYRCLANGDHFTSVDPACEGYITEAKGGYVFTVPQPGTVPLFRCYHSSIGDHLTTKNPAECQKYNYNVEFVLGYVM